MRLWNQRGRFRRVASAAVAALAISFVPVAASVGVASAATPQALINGDTVSGGYSSPEANLATSDGFQVTVVNGATWDAMTQAQFAQYQVLIAGDPYCGSIASSFRSNESTWAPVVMGTAGGNTRAGNRVLVGTDPVFHSGGTGARATVISDGIAFAGQQPGRTGLYFDTSCGGNYYGQTGVAASMMGKLSSGSGTWSEDDNPPCGGNVAKIASTPAFNSLTTADLEGWGCSVHESFPTFASDWSALAVATDTSSHPTCGTDTSVSPSVNACGEAYVLIAGSGIVVVSPNIALTPTTSTDPVGTSHTVDANVARSGSPVVGQTVTFTVTGQNSGVTGTCVPVNCATDANGNVSFTYADTNGAGSDTIYASFTDSSGSTQQASAAERWMGVAEAITASGTPASSVEGNSFSGLVATVTDTSPTSTASEFTAATNWGDSSTSTDTVTGPTGGPFTVSGSHTYSDEGSDTVTTTITDTLAPSINATATSIATVGDASLTPGVVKTLAGVEGAAVSGSIGTFSDANPRATASDFIATINWGDSKSSTGTVAGPTGGPFTVSGNHTYAEEGSYALSVAVSDVGGSGATLGTTATISDATITSSCVTSALSGLSYNGNVAVLSDANSGSTSSDFTATINWGDGSSSAGTISGSGGSYHVSGSHSYRTTGYYNISTSVADVGGSSTTSAPCSVLVYTGGPGGGHFVVGNDTATGSVLFWGAHWSKTNRLSGGAAPASFKGYAASPSTAACHLGWSTAPGNSSSPPSGPLPAYMSVIVASTATQSGSKVSGNTEHVVIVKTASGYANDPGHAGTGTVVATVC